MRFGFIPLILHLSILAHAGPRAAKVLRVEQAPTRLSATLPEGYHFNEKAPNRLHSGTASQPPSQMRARELVFDALPPEWTTATVFVCDDALTFCESETITRTGLAKKPTGTVAGVPNRNRGKLDAHGFIQDDFEKALADARRKKQPMILDFSAKWCPGCVRLETEYLPTREFREASRGFVKAHFDVDRFENQVVSERYAIYGIPAFIITNSEGEEISRLLDYNPPEVFTAMIKDAETHPASLAELKTKAEAGDLTVNLTLGRRLLIAGRAAEALTYLDKVTPPPPERLQALIDQADTAARKLRDQPTATDKDKQAAKAARVSALEQALKAESDTTRSIDWRAALAGLTDDKALKAKLRADGLRLIDELEKDPARLQAAAKSDRNTELYDFRGFTLAMQRADLLSATEAPEAEVIAAWRQAVEKGKVLTPKQVGPGLRYLMCLMQAKMYSEADQWLQSLIKVNPGNFDLVRRRVRVLTKLQKYDEAVRVGRAVLKKTYGQNEFWTAELLVQSLFEKKDFAGAEKLINSYLARPEINWPDVSTTKKTLEDLKAKLPKAS